MINCYNKCMVIFTYRNYCGNSKALAERCLKQLLKKDVYISYYGDGKPYVVDEDLYISISHTYKDIVIAISEKEVGIDIEYKKSRHYQTIADNMLKKDILDIDDFYREWTKHEAQFKHGGENGSFAYFDLFKDTQTTVFSEDKEYKFIPMETFIE